MGSDEIDRRLEEALASYAAVEPRPGIEARVLARVETRRAFVPWWAWALAAACAAAFFVPTPKDPPPPRLLQARIAPPVIAYTRPIAEQAARARRRRAAAPKLPQFPAPSPLTEEERAMIALVRQAPQVATQVVQAQEKQFEPIRIEEIRIEPIADGQ